MAVPVCFVNTNNAEPSTKKVLGWTVFNEQPHFGSCVVVNGHLMAVENWFWVTQLAATTFDELREATSVPASYLEVWVIDEAEAKKRMIAARVAEARRSGALVLPDQLNGRRN